MTGCPCQACWTRDVVARATAEIDARIEPQLAAAEHAGARAQLIAERAAAIQILRTVFPSRPCTAVPEAVVSC